MVYAVLCFAGYSFKSVPQAISGLCRHASTGALVPSVAMPLALGTVCGAFLSGRYVKFWGFSTQAAPGKCKYLELVSYFSDCVCLCVICLCDFLFVSLLWVIQCKRPAVKPNESDSSNTTQIAKYE